jgi:hypothetical protein
MLDLVSRSSSESHRLLDADEFNFGCAALAPGSSQRSALADDPNSVALDGDSGRSLAGHDHRPQAVSPPSQTVFLRLQNRDRVRPARVSLGAMRDNFAGTGVASLVNALKFL